MNRKLVSVILSTLVVVAGLTPIAANASTDCVVDNFTNAVGSDTNGDRTFRYCMTAGAQAGETITFDHQRSQQVIELESVVSRSTLVTIDGEGYVTLTLADGSSDFRMIDISAGIEVIGMTFRDGNASQGSAIHTTSSGDVTVRDSDFIDNEATVTGSGADVAEGGGAIKSEGNVFVYDSTFSGNISGHDGGAILAEDNVTVEDSTFSSNTAVDDGGAIYSWTGDITVTDSTFTGNKATEGEGTNHASNGGALYTSEDDVFVFDSTFTDNEADDDGGAVYSEDDDDGSTFSGSTFMSNTAGVDGGAVYVDNSSDDVAEFEDCSFLENTAGDDGGAIYIDESAKLVESTLQSNRALDSGGAIYAEDESVEVEDSLFVSNHVDNDGGAIYADADFTSIRSSFVSNSANDVGGAVESDDDVIVYESYFGLNIAGGDGGALDISDELDVYNSTFYKNHSADQGGAIWSSEDEATAGSYIVYSTFIDNTADTEGSTFHFLGDDLDLFANLMISSQDEEQITGETGDIVDYGANVSSFEGEPVFDNPTSVTGVDLAALGARDPRTATLGFQPTVRFNALAKTEAEVTQELLDNYETETGRTLPTTDQLGNTRTASFFAGAEFLRWRSAYPIDYAGPVITDIGDNGVVAPFVVYGGEAVRVVGERLSSINKVFVDGKEAELSEITDETFVLVFPDGVTEGTHDLVVQSSIGILTHTDGFLVRLAGTDLETSAGCVGVQTTVWTQRISDTQAKAYIKCPEAGKKYRILHQTGGSGSYESVLARTLESQDDTVQVFNEFGRYIVRTIDLVDINRLRITVDDSEVWKVRYNR